MLIHSCYLKFGILVITSPEVGLNIFYFKRKGITNKHKAYEWLSRSSNKAEFLQNSQTSYG